MSFDFVKITLQNALFKFRFNLQVIIQKLCISLTLVYFYLTATLSVKT